MIRSTATHTVSHTPLYFKVETESYVLVNSVVDNPNGDDLEVFFAVAQMSPSSDVYSSGTCGGSRPRINTVSASRPEKSTRRRRP